MSIYVTRPSLPSLDEFIDEVKPVFDSYVLTNMGPVYKKFQRLLIQYLDVTELSLFVNGHMALEMAIEALGLKKAGERLNGGEVITTPFTFASTVHAICRNGLTPVFCDIDPDTYCLSPEKLESLITEKTVGIIPVHVFGNVCDVYSIGDIAERHHLKLIYDAAHAFGVKYRNQGIGNFGHATMFSFHATKVFHCVEGGAVAFQDKRYGVPLHELKNFGIHSEEDVAAIGANAKLNELCSAMGICNLRRIDQTISARKKIYEKYYQRLSGIPGLILCKEQKDVTPNYAYMPICINGEEFGKDRNDIYLRLKKNDIYARKYFYPAVNELSCYKDRSNEETPVAHNVAESILTLPIYEGLSEQDVDRICDVILMGRPE